MTTLYKFNVDCGRYGELHGLFVADSDKVRALIDCGKDVYFGEVLGKHSEISLPMDDDCLTALSTDAEFIAQVQAAGCLFGYNPFDYIDEDVIAESNDA